jgi:hypothetical protein
LMEVAASEPATTADASGAKTPVKKSASKGSSRPKKTKSRKG